MEVGKESSGSDDLLYLSWAIISQGLIRVLLSDRRVLLACVVNIESVGRKVESWEESAKWEISHLREECGIGGPIPAGPLFANRSLLTQCYVPHHAHLQCLLMNHLHENRGRLLPKLESYKRNHQRCRNVRSGATNFSPGRGVQLRSYTVAVTNGHKSAEREETGERQEDIVLLTDVSCRPEAG